MPRVYKTQGRCKLEAFMSAHPDAHYTVDEICVAVNGSLNARSSIYRNLSALCDEGVVRKFNGEDGEASVYQYLAPEKSCRDHFHLKCLECGRLEHLECYVSDDLCNHINLHHGFKVDGGRSILYGVCEECALKNKKKIII